MNAPNFSHKSELIDKVASRRENHTPPRNLIPIVSGILILVALLCASFYLSVDVSASRDASAKPNGSVAGVEPTSSVIEGLGADLTSPLLRNIALFTPQAGVTVTTYAGDCTTPKSVFNLQDTDLTVCAKVTGGQATWVIIWSNPSFEAKQNTPLGTGESTFTLNANSSLGDWRVIAYEPFGGSVYALTRFTVIDAANPSADLAISKGTQTATVAAGSQAVFNVEVTNFGPTDATNVQVTDAVPFNTAFSSYGVVSGPSGINCTNPSLGATSGESICTIPTLARGETAVFVGSYDLAGGVAAGTVISSTATVQSVAGVGETPPPAIPDPNTANNSSSAEIVVSGVTSETCTLDCPANVVVTADTTVEGQFGAVVSFGAAAVTGNCGSVSNSPSSGSFFPVGTHSIISSAQFGGSCTFTVTVLDTNPPTIFCPANKQRTAAAGETEFSFSPEDPGPGTPTINASGGGTVTGVRSDDTPAVLDENGNVVTPAVVHDLGGPYPIGTTGILWTVTDAGGRKASCSQSIIILSAGDRDPVTISCPGNVSVTAPSGSCEATIAPSTIGTPTTNLTDSHIEVVAQRSDGQSLTDPFPAGLTQITWTATDDLNGNHATCVQNVTVNAGGGADTTPPVLTVPANLNLTTSSCSLVLDDELGAAEASDNGACGGSVTITRTGVPAGFVFPTGTTTIIYTATDAAGNTSTGLQLVTITESPAVPPTISAPADVSANTGPGATSCGTVVSDAALGTAIANDNCGGVVVTRTGVPAGNMFPVGNTTVTYTATDRSGNTATDTQVVTVTDNTVPIVTAPAAVTLFTGPGATSCGVTVGNLDTTLGTGSATDNCPGVGAVTRTGVPAGNAFPVGQTTVTYSATDAHGNTGSATQVVTVVDNTKPIISHQANIVVEPTCPSGAIATYPDPTATDNCGIQTIVRTAGLASGAVFPIGTTTVSHTATDIYGNTDSWSFTVTVLTPQAVIQNLQVAVAASSLTGTQKNGLLSKLSAALQGINNGQPNVACPKLNDFINSVQNLVSQGNLSSATGTAWISSAQHIRNTIGCTSLPCS